MLKLLLLFNKSDAFLLKVWSARSRENKREVFCIITGSTRKQEMIGFRFTEDLERSGSEGKMGSRENLK